MAEPPTPQPKIDTSMPHSARVWNYWLGGKDNFAVDREIGDQYRQAFPGIVEIARADRAFLRRVVEHVAGKEGVRQFLDVGTGLPTHGNTHEVAQQVAPESRIVYADNDPLVLVHAQALLVSGPRGRTDYIHADLREPEKILHEAARTLDFTQPVGIMLLGILHFVEDLDEVEAIVNRLLDAAPSGSYLALTHATQDLGGEANAEAQRIWNENSPVKITARTKVEIGRFLNRLDVLAPGLVSLSQWLDEWDPQGVARAEVAGYCALGRKP